MSSTISIEIPREILHAARMTPQELKRELAIYLFQQGRLSFGKAREMAEMTSWTFQQLLASRGVPPQGASRQPDSLVVGGGSR